MNIFEYLKDDEANLERRLKLLTTHYFEWPTARIFEESIKLFSSVVTHLEKKEALLAAHLSQLDATMVASLKESTQQRYAIEAQIDGLTQRHVDEDGFQQGLDSLLRLMINHRKYCEAYFYPAVSERLSAYDRSVLNAELEELVLS